MESFSSDTNSWMPEWRHAKWDDAEHKRCTLEINHPDFGWIPFTLDPNDKGTYVDTPGLYAAVCAAGCECAEYVPPTAEELLQQERVDMHVTRFQFKAALLEQGRLDAVLAAIGGADAVTRMAWEETVHLTRLQSRVVKWLVDNGHLTEEEMDSVFREAAKVEQ